MVRFRTSQILIKNRYAVSTCYYYLETSIEVKWFANRKHHEKDWRKSCSHHWGNSSRGYTTFIAVRRSGLRMFSFSSVTLAKSNYIRHLSRSTNPIMIRNVHFYENLLRFVVLFQRLLYHSYRLSLFTKIKTYYMKKCYQKAKVNFFGEERICNLWKNGFMRQWSINFKKCDFDRKPLRREWWKLNFDSELNGWCYSCLVTKRVLSRHLIPKWYSKALMPVSWGTLLLTSIL